MPAKRKKRRVKSSRKSKRKPVRNKVSYIPKGFHTVTPYIMIRGAAAMLDFVKKAFGAKEKHRSSGPDGAIWHADVLIGDSHVMIADATEQWPATPAGIYMYVKNTDAVYKSAIEAGAVSLQEPSDQFYGDRTAGVKDQWGNSWYMGTHLEDVSPKELQKRMATMKK